MAGRWTTVYIDGEYKDIWIDMPVSIRTGSASTASGPPPVLLDKHGKPLSPAPKRLMGFHLIYEQKDK